MATKAELSKELSDLGYDVKGLTRKELLALREQHLAQDDEVLEDEVIVTEEPAVEEEPESRPPCDNHPDRESAWSSDGVKASVIHLCGDCKRRGV